MRYPWSRKSIRKRSTAGRGNTIVETCLILTAAMITFIGIIDVGSVLFRLQGLNERARAGARYAVVNTFNAAKIQNVVVYGNSAGTGSALLGLSTSLVTANYVDLGDGTAKVQVIIAAYPFRFFTPFIAGSSTLPTIEMDLTTESLGAAS